MKIAMMIISIFFTLNVKAYEFKCFGHNNLLPNDQNVIEFEVETSGETLIVYPLEYTLTVTNDDDQDKVNYEGEEYRPALFKTLRLTAFISTFEHIDVYGPSYFDFNFSKWDKDKVPGKEVKVLDIDAKCFRR